MCYTYFKLIKQFFNFSDANISDLRMCIGSLAHMNINPSLCKPAISYLASRLQPSNREEPQKWLNSVYALACLKSLTPKLAESVLREEFRKELFAKIPDGFAFFILSPKTSIIFRASKLFTIQKLCQINAAAKFEIKDYRGTLANFDDLQFDVNHIFK